MRTKLWRAVLGLLLASGGGCAAMAQAKPAHPELKTRPDELPLTVTENTALSAIGEKLQAKRQEEAQLAQLARSIEAEIRAEHPGYHFDEATGKIVKDATPAKGPVK